MKLDKEIFTKKQEEITEAFHTQDGFDEIVLAFNNASQIGKERFLILLSNNNIVSLLKKPFIYRLRP